jgi:hypothetical protein
MRKIKTMFALLLAVIGLICFQATAMAQTTMSPGQVYKVETPESQQGTFIVSTQNDVAVRVKKTPKGTWESIPIKQGTVTISVGFFNQFICTNYQFVNYRYSPNVSVENAQGEWAIDRIVCCG